MATPICQARLHAKETGIKQYSTGKPCRHGHMSNRYTCDGRCVACDHIYTKKRHKENPEYWNSRAREWQRNNPDKAHARNKRHRARSINNRIAENLRSRLYQELIQKYKRAYKRTWSSVEALGCSTEFARQYIEAQFRDDMSWDNWGSVWHLDHIIPLADFDLTDPEQGKLACRYTNLQPLLIEEHKKKSAKDLRNTLKNKKEIIIE